MSHLLTGINPISAASIRLSLALTTVQDSLSYSSAGLFEFSLSISVQNLLEL